MSYLLGVLSGIGMVYLCCWIARVESDAEHRRKVERNRKTYGDSE